MNYKKGEMDIDEQKKIRHEKETIYVDIPQGVDNNEIILIKEKGKANKKEISNHII